MQDVFNEFQSLAFKVRSLSGIVQNEIEFESLTKEQKDLLRENLQEFYARCDGCREELSSLKKQVTLLFTEILI